MSKKKKWSEFSLIQKLLSMVGVLIQTGLLLAAQWDIQRRSNDEIRGPKWIWRAIVFINFIGPIAYFLFGRIPDTEILAPIPGSDD